MAQNHGPVHSVLEGIRTAGVDIRIGKRGAIEIPYGDAESALVRHVDRATGGGSGVPNDCLRRRNVAVDRDRYGIRMRRSGVEPSQTDATNLRGNAYGMANPSGETGDATEAKALDLSIPVHKWGRSHTRDSPELVGFDRIA